MGKVLATVIQKSTLICTKMCKATVKLNAYRQSLQLNDFLTDVTIKPLFVESMFLIRKFIVGRRDIITSNCFSIVHCNNV